MPRKTTSLEYLEDTDIAATCDYPVPEEYSRPDTSGFGALLRAEIDKLERWAELENRPAAIFEVIAVRGLDYHQAGKLFNIEPAAVEEIYTETMKRLRKYPHIGVFTVLVETFGWSTAAEVVYCQ